MKNRRNSFWFRGLAFVPLRCLAGLLFWIRVESAIADPVYPDLQIPAVGDHELHVLTPKLLELVRINTKPPGGSVDSWDWVNGGGNFVPPDMSSIKVIVNGQTNSIVNVGFKRRPFYAPQATWDLRIANSL